MTAPETPHVCRTCGLAEWKEPRTIHGERVVEGVCMWAGPRPLVFRDIGNIRIDDTRPCRTWNPKEAL